jgi:small GTP-binding protein
MSNLFKIKTVMIGEAGSGKSCIINRIIYNEYDEFGSATVGAQFLAKKIGENIKLEIWDTAGQERYRALIPMYLRNAQIICLVISLEKSYEQIEYEKQFWLNYLNIQNTMSKVHQIILIFNKCDLKPDIEIQNDERFDFIFIVSCKNRTGIDTFLNSLENNIITKLNNTISKNIEIPLNPIENNINTNENNGLIDYTYSVGKKIMNCCIL